MLTFVAGAETSLFGLAKCRQKAEEEEIEKNSTETEDWS